MEGREQSSFEASTTLSGHIRVIEPDEAPMCRKMEGLDRGRATPGRGFRRPVCRLRLQETKGKRENESTPCGNCRGEGKKKGGGGGMEWGGARSRGAESCGAFKRASGPGGGRHACVSGSAGCIGWCGAWCRAERGQARSYALVPGEAILPGPVARPSRCCGKPERLLMGAGNVDDVQRAPQGLSGRGYTRKRTADH